MGTESFREEAEGAKRLGKSIHLKNLAWGRAACRLALEDEYDIALARDGIEALQKVEAVNPTLLVLDVMLPRLSGYDVCLKLKEDSRTQHLPILMLSARGEKQAIVKGFYAGADDYLPKPFDPEELLLRISALIRRCKAH